MYKKKKISKSFEVCSKLRRNNKLKKYSENNISRNNIFKNHSFKRKEAIHLEVINLIKENMINIESKLNDIYSKSISRTYDEDNFKNYSGEKISIFSISQNDKTDELISNFHQKRDNNTQEIKSKIKYQKDMQFIFKSKKKNNDEKNKFNNTKLLSKINKNINTYGIYRNEERMVISSNVGRINESSLENDNVGKEKERKEILSFSEKKYNHKHNFYINKKIMMKKNSAQSENQKIKSYFKDRKLSIPNNFSLYESTSTSNTYEKNKLKFYHSYDKRLKNNEIELAHFFEEINLPLNYSKNFIENGFDDLNIILNLTKTSIALTNQNLKDVGILNSSHRAKILIHLEEKAGIIPYHLERNIIYNENDSQSNNKILGEKLTKFFNEIKSQKYLDNFKINGYFNVELLLTQMLIRQPINSKILKEDFYIDDELCRNRILNKLEIESRKYMKRLQKKNIYNNNINDDTIIYEDKLFHNPCEYCLIF